MSEHSRSDHNPVGSLAGHQAALADLVMRAPRPTRVLLAATPGSGRSAALVHLVRCLGDGQGGLPRVLVVAPARLHEQWLQELGSDGEDGTVVVDGPMLRRLEARTPADRNPWGEYRIVVTSLEFLARREDRLETALSVPWAMTIIVESDQCSADSPRALALGRIWARTSLPIAVAIALEPSQPDWMPTTPAVRVLQWATAVPPLHRPKRLVRIHRYPNVESEKAFQRLLGEFVADLPAGRAYEMLGRALFRRWRSSVFAVDISLRRLAAFRDDMAVLSATASPFPEEGAGDDLSATTDRFGMQDWSALQFEKVERLTDALAQIPTDSRWRAIAEGLSPMLSGAAQPIPLFTDFADTADFVARAASQTGWPAASVTTASTDVERDEAFQTTAAGRSILVVTTAAAYGLALSSSPDVVHVDMPSGVQGLQQRIGRVERVGTSVDQVRHHTFVSEDEDIDETARLWELAGESEITFA